jgi:L,D-peptidoglycan transpeptidase YkuD (ErfK/YbiS/YcfS/YnhG family)
MIRIVLAVLVVLGIPAGAFQLPADSTQCVVALADGWNSSRATVSFYEKTRGQWRQVGASWQSRLGRDGLVWGRGIHPNPPGATLKTEGDMRAPAGVFHLGGAWGYHRAIQKHPKLFYRQVTPRDLWIEDPHSPDYNRHLVLQREPRTAWETKQQMRLNDYPHSLKLFIAHNAPPNVVPNGGSAIFFHIWREGGNRPTAGCTTMSEERLRWLIGRIDPTRRPLYVLLPRAEYEKLRSSWQLP